MKKQKPYYQYRVKLSAKGQKETSADSQVNGYLAFNGEIMLYGKRAATGKAELFGGTIEPVESTRLPKPENILKIADFYPGQLSETVLKALADVGELAYRDTILWEHIYDIERSLERNGEQLTPEVKTELQTLQTLLDKHGCAYLRIIYN